MKKNYIILLFITALSAPVSGQVATSIHDASKMNQITMMELGTGHLTPEFYYTLTHPNYKNSAAKTNKLTYRSYAGLNAYQQIDMAETIDSSLVKRSRIEALNIADRSGGALDLAWVSEGDKINSALSALQKNITRLDLLPRAAVYKTIWQEQYNKYECAVEAIVSSYMPNSQRQKQYVQIYQDICRDNETLVKVIVMQKKYNDMKLWENVNPLTAADKSAIAAQAFERWVANSGMNNN